MKHLLFIFLFAYIHNCIAQDTPQLIAPQGHGIFPHDFDISADSKTIATCGLDKKIVLWDIRTGIPFRSIIGHSAEIRSIRYSWNGEYIITASPDSTVKIWDSKSLTLIRTIATRQQNTYAEFNRFTTQIVVACNNGTAKIYDLNGQLIQEIKAHTGIVNCAVFSTNGNLIFTGGDDHYLRAFMIDSKKRLLDWDTEATVHQLFFDTFNSVLVAHTGNGRAELILMPNFESYGAVPVETMDYFGAIRYVSNIDVSPDNNYFTYADKKGQVFIADAKTKFARGFQTTHDDFISKVKYSYDMKYLVSLGHDNKMTIAALHTFDFDKSQQMPVRIVKQESDYPKNVYFDHDNRIYIRGFHTYDFDLVTGEIEHQPIHLSSVQAMKNTLQQIRVERGPKFTVLIDSLRNVVLLDYGKEILDPIKWCIDPTRTFMALTANNSLYTFNLKKNQPVGQFTYDNNKLAPRKIIVSSQGEIGTLEKDKLVWYTHQGKKLWEYKLKGITDVDVSLQGNEIALGSFDPIVYIINDQGKLIHKHPLQDVSCEYVKWAHSGNKIALTGYNPYISIIDKETGKTTWKTPYDNGALAVLCFDKKDKILAVIGADRVVQLFDVTKTKQPPIFHIFPMREDGIMVSNQDNYYTSTREAVGILAYNYKGTIYPCEQFDAHFNRPDLVLSNSPYYDAEYLALLSAAYQKRIKLLGNPSQMKNEATPFVDIVNMGDFPNYIMEKEVSILVEAKDSMNDLKSIQVWLNGVPLYGKEGKSITGKTYRENLKIELVTGPNTIKIAAVNHSGIESMKSRMDINYQSKTKPNLYIACVGVSEYDDTRFNLKYAAKDAADLLSSIEKSNAFGQINKTLLSNKMVTKSEIAQLKSFFEQAGRDDVVILFVAGHGLLDKDLNYYYATADIDFEQPQNKGIAYSELEKLLEDLKAVKKLLLMDTCHSGELDKDEVADELAVVSVIDTAVTFRSAGAQLSTSKGAARTSLLVKELFADIRQSTGTTVISSSSGFEFSMESDQWKNGLFTYCLIQGLQGKEADKNMDGEISVSELQEYIKKTVLEKSGGRQVPTFRVHNIEMDFPLL
jgi:WD40 repeat protein